MNFAVLFVPDFALQALRRSEPTLHGKPVALAAGEGRKAALIQVAPEATNVEPGMAVLLALARCPGLIIRPRSATAESEAMRLAIAAALSLSPRVEATDDGACTVDLRGTEPIRTEKQMHSCVAELATCGLRARIGAAETPLLAFYAAQRAEPVKLVRDKRDFLAPLPIAVAGPSRIQAEVLQGWGIGTLGQLTALPKTQVAQRLGTEGVLLWERAAGDVTRVLRLVEPPKTYVVEWTYEPPVESMEPLLFRLQRFAECLALELRAAGMAADQLSLVLLLEDETDHARDFRLPEPSSDVASWLRVLHAHLETVRTEARVTGVRLRANPTRPLEKQDGLFDTGLRDPAAFWENFARLGAIVGDDCVGTPRRVDTWRPDAILLEKPTEVIATPESEPVNPLRGLTLRRFRPPWAASVQLLDERPVSFSTAEGSGMIRYALGPFRLSGNWWQPPGNWWVEFWHAETDHDTIYQLARTAAGWTVEGVLD